MNKDKEEELPLIKLEFYTPEGPLPVFTKRRKKYISPYFVGISAFLLIGLILFISLGAPLPGFIKIEGDRWGFVKELEKYRPRWRKKPHPAPDTTQKTVKRPPPEEVIPEIMLSMGRKRGLRYLVERSSLRPITALYSLDDDFIFVEGLIDSVRGGLTTPAGVTILSVDSLLQRMFLNEAVRMGKVITKDSTRQRVKFTLRLEKKLIERTWEKSYVSIPPYKRAKALATLDSLVKSTGVKGEFMPIDEKNYERYSQFLLLLDGKADLGEFKKLIIGIDELPFFLQLKSCSFLPGERGEGRLLLLAGINYLFPAESKTDTLAKGQ